MKLSLSAVIFLIAASVFITYQATYTAIEARHSETVYTLVDNDSTYTKLNAVDDIVRASYIHDIDEEKLEEGLILGYLYGLNDKYASYLTADEYESYLNETSSSRVGLGITVIYDSSIGGMYVSSVNKDSPAINAGIREGDIIYAVDGKDIGERGYYETITHISSGKEGEPVTVSVRKAPDYVEFTEYSVPRATIENTTVEYELFNSDIGYVKISSFNESTPDEFNTAMEKLASEGAVKYVFDVRSNPGGDLTSISAILDKLLPEGPIIRIQKKTEGETVITSDAACIDAPMAVIVNESTASAAELFASALRDYDKAKLVGKKTYGKGTLQTIQRLSPEIGGGALSISTGMYNPPKSENYEGVGLVPDLDIDIPKELKDEFHNIPLIEDPQFLAAVATITPPSNPTE